MRRGRPAKQLTLSKDAVAALESWYRDHPSHRSRQRAQDILLNARGHSAIALATLYGVREETVREWLSRYERSGVEGLLDLPKSGRPTRYSEEQLQGLWPWLREAPRRLREIQTHLTDTTGKTAHPTTLKRYLKKNKDGVGNDFAIVSDHNVIRRPLYKNNSNKPLGVSKGFLCTT